MAGRCIFAITLTLTLTPRFRHERGEDGVDCAAAAGGTEEDEDEHDDELGDSAAAFVPELVGEDAESGFDGFAFGVECDALLFQLGNNASQTIFLPHPLDQEIRMRNEKKKEKKGTPLAAISHDLHLPIHPSIRPTRFLRARALIA